MSTRDDNRKVIPIDDDKAKKERDQKTLEAYQSALDDVVSVNGFFTAAVFLGLTFSKNVSLQKDPRCTLSDDNSVARRLLVNEVISFSCFLLSSLVAKALKSCLFIYSVNVNASKDIHKIKHQCIRLFMLLLSMAGTIIGCIFLTVSMMDVIRMRLGKITCGHAHDAKIASISMITIISLALLIYVPLSMAAAIKTVQKFEGNSQNKGPVKQKSLISRTDQGENNF